MTDSTTNAPPTPATGGSLARARSHAPQIRCLTRDNSNAAAAAGVREVVRERDRRGAGAGAVGGQRERRAALAGAAGRRDADAVAAAQAEARDLQDAAVVLAQRAEERMYLFGRAPGSFRSPFLFEEFIFENDTWPDDLGRKLYVPA